MKEMSNENYKNELKTVMEVCDKIQREELKLWVKNLLYWYIKHANINKRLWYLRNFVSIAIPAVISLIPAVTSENSIETDGRIIMAVLGVISTIVISFLSFLNLEKKHLLYRRAAEDIKRILFVNLTDSSQSPDYEKMKKDIEACVMDEQIGWRKIKTEMGKENSDS